MNKLLIVTAIIAFLIGLYLGFQLGVYFTIRQVAEIAGNFIEINYEMVEQAIFQYKHHIGGCF